RSDPIGVDDRAPRVPLVLRHVPRPKCVLPRIEPFGRRLFPVAERKCPETREAFGVRAVDNHLHTSRHRDHRRTDLFIFVDPDHRFHADDWDPLARVSGRGRGWWCRGHLVSFPDENEEFVGMLGVIEPWRGRGIATTLLRRAFAEISTRDRTEV